EYPAVPGKCRNALLYPGAGAIERTRSLLEDFDEGELSILLDQIDRLTRNAKKMLAEEKAEDESPRK
ncbi:MAG: hypothetical protein WAO01_13600, partial [Bradyrhizobium sp.]